MTTRRTRRAFIGTAAAGVTGSWLASRVPALRAQAADSRLEILVDEPIGAIAPVAPRSGVVTVQSLRGSELPYTFAAASVTRLQLTLG